MAVRKKMKLCPYTVTCHLGKGEHVTSVMHRSKPPEDDDNDDDDVENCTSESDYDSHSLQPSFESALDMPTSTHWDELPSHHSIKQRAAEEAWKGRREVYGFLIDSFEEYRYMKHELRTLSFLDQLDSGNVCPACPKDGGSKIVSLDAIFGLPRRKNAGISFNDSLHGNLFFACQSEVDEFVTNNSIGSENNVEECSNFKAGSMLRSASRYHALDETGVFGAGCRHEFPIYFCSLKHGERYAYSIWIMENLIGHSTSEHHFIYDIACNLSRHLKKCGREDLLKNIASLSVPSFHSYGHTASCQVDFSPVRTEGIGLSDGEVMERLWSFLRRFCRMTKEMRPSHRINVLTDALLFYSNKRTEKLSKLLVSRWSRAQSTHAIAHQNLEELKASLNATEGDILKFIEEERSLVLCKSSDGTKESIKSIFARRKFLLELKGKYADGQKIAKKLSAQIKKETLSLKRLLEKHKLYKYEDIINPNSDFWEPVDVMNVSAEVYKMRRSAIHNYLLLQRSEEELELLKQDMLNTLQYFKHKLELIKENQVTIMSEPQTLYNSGLSCLLLKYEHKILLLYNKSKEAFAPIVPALPFFESALNIQVDTDSDDTDDEFDGSEFETDSESEYMYFICIDPDYEYFAFDVFQRFVQCLSLNNALWKSGATA
uniref:CxC1-like cysteine cluster associated with KDZ transposases domain-containing protein n=1 Tax=Amphimedon queenslandica TaxID=400682 RepID=A0A1X7UAW0_AMPQE